MNLLDKEIKKQAEAFVPAVPESYAEMISGTVSTLEKSVDHPVRSGRKIWKPIAAAAAAAAFMLAASALLFGARPALAAELPVVSDMVYSAAPKKHANEADVKRIEALLNTAFRSLAACDYETASRCFRENRISGRDNFLAAAYFDHLVGFDDFFPGSAEAADVRISELDAEQKAFRFTVRVTLCCVSRDGTEAGEEECLARVWENVNGMYIERLEMQSEGYKAYAARYESVFGAVPESGASVEMIPTDNGYLTYAAVFAASEGPRQRADRIASLIAELGKVSATIAEKQVRSELLQNELENAESAVTPAVTSAEEAAAELMFRYWLGRKTGEICDFSDIMERNEQTDLFLWDALLEAEKTELCVLKPLVTVEKESAVLIGEPEETDGIIKARIYVYTSVSDGVSQGVGEEIILTLRREADGYIIIGFDKDVGDGYYVCSVKPKAAQYKAAGYSWQEAGRLTYELLHEELVGTAEAYPMN